VVGSFADGHAALMLVAARLRPCPAPSGARAATSIWTCYAITCRRRAKDVLDAAPESKNQSAKNGGHHQWANSGGGFTGARAREQA
jgi:hypothetical protein